MTLISLWQNRRKQIRRLYRRWRTTILAKRLHTYSNRPKLAKAYLIIALALLFGTTLLWSLLGARLQQSNADQLVNAYLFQDGPTFHGAVFPAQHSFLIKWPLFLLVKLFGYSAAGFVGLTAAVVMLTVGMLVFLLSRINRQPIILGTLCLMLASILLLIPAQPYPGGLLPLNMAMATTRNLEYILYIAGLFCLVKAPRLRSRQFYAAVILFSLLVASDKLFLYISFGGALLALISYIAYKRWRLVNLSWRWLLISISGGLGAVVIVWLINYAQLTHIGIEARSLGGPTTYGLAHGLKAIGLGVIYAIGGLLTNFGANPAYDSLTIQQIPRSLVHNLYSLAGPAYAVNLGVFRFGLIISLRFFLRSLRPVKSNKAIQDWAESLAILLLWTTLAAICLFVATNHYYVVDGRYLSVSLFTMFVVLASWTRGKRLLPELWLLSIVLLGISIVFGLIAAVGTYQTQKRALATVDQRNKVIGQTINNHRVDVLIGDYWRVIPTKSITGNSRQTVLPLADCSKPRTVLTSSQWQPDLRYHSFAYLLTLDGSLTGYPHCTLRQVAAAYGLPSSSALIAGTLSKPKELLLFYDHGIHKSFSKTVGRPPLSTTVLPIKLADLPRPNCHAPAIMHIVAHQDDDLLFMNPDVLHGIKTGHCISSVYLTAGDAGAAARYWLAREQGSEAAYSQMLGTKAVWIQHIARLPGGQLVMVANPSDNRRITLIFMRLPDGNLQGEGFGVSNHESLASLEAGSLTRIETVDHKSNYDANQLTAGLAALMHLYKPAEIRTQSNYASVLYPDHSDHSATGYFASLAHKQYEAEQYGGNLTVPIKFYIGYPIRQFVPNVSGRDLMAKENAFLAYAVFDDSVCRSIKQCRTIPTYGNYLDKQYRNPY